MKIGKTNMLIVLTLFCATFPAAAIPAYFNLDGPWGYTMHSYVSGKTHIGMLMLKREGLHISGSFNAFDKSNAKLDGSYDPTTGTLSLWRDTGLETVQTFALKRIGSELVGSFRNDGKYRDFGTIEFQRMSTL